MLCTAPFWKDDLIQISPKEKVIYNYLKLLPYDSVIAAPIKLADNIPVFSKKSVFVSYEAEIPFHKTYYKEMKSRINTWTKLYYSGNLLYLKRFLQKNKIDYIVIDKNDFKVPYRYPNLLSQTLDAYKIFQAGNYIIVPVSKIIDAKDCLLLK